MRTQLRSARLRLAAWAGNTGLAAETVDDLVLATYEALVNVADHAYREGEGEASLEAVREGGCVDVTVCDKGSWRPPPADPGLRGRGMTLIGALAEGVTVKRGETGTAVTMHWCVGPHAHPDSARDNHRAG